MTPKENADKLFKKFAMYLSANLMFDKYTDEDAIQCALIAVDEIIYMLKNEDIIYGWRYKQITDPVFWGNVKQELNKRQ